jgi:hypothetical protein
MSLDGQILDRGADISGGKVSAHVDTASSQAITGNDPRLPHAVDGKKLTVKSGGVVPMASASGSCARYLDRSLPLVKR